MKLLTLAATMMLAIAPPDRPLRLQQAMSSHTVTWQDMQFLNLSKN